MIDLHMHSIFSDGTSTPEELIEEGNRAGLTAMALTDHDTVSGVARFLTAAQTAGIRALSGVEVSADSDTGTMHILGYGVDPANPSLVEHLAWIRQGRDERNQEILQKLNQLGLRMTYEEIASYAGADVVGRPHFAQAMIAKGYVRDKRDAFDRYLARGKPAYAERRRLDPGGTLELIRGAGGVPVLAHPFTLKLSLSKLKSHLEGLRAQGLQGLEVYYSEHTPAMQADFARLAKSLDLVATGGTDYHGKVSPGIRLGVGFGSLRIPDGIFDEIQARRAA
jgi:predicted metal-dependent phosphoesterase TrpH